MDTNQTAKYAFVAALAAFLIGVIAHWQSHAWPGAQLIVPEVKLEPEQTPTVLPPLYRREKNYSTIYEIKPRFEYKIRGLVVATHDSRSWNDMSHAAWGDTLNSADLCVVWGDANTDPALLNKLSFSHGDWTCYFQTGDSAAYTRFKQNQISNNHILPADAVIARAVASTEIGDQIEIEGQLVDYSINGRPPRITSITRDDVGDGACEIIYATTFRRLSRAHTGWHFLRRLSFAVSLAGFALAFTLYFAWPLIRRADD